jgi:hypothetical protein
MKNKALRTIALLALLALPSCLGPNRLFNSVNNWNAQVTQSKYLNELIFIGFWILPVYQISYAGDALIFNTIEFWGGENPIKEPQDFETQAEK